MKKLNKFKDLLLQFGSAGMPRPTRSWSCAPKVGQTLRVSRSLLYYLIAGLNLGAIFVLMGGCAKKSAQHFGPPFTDAPRVTIAQLLDKPDAYRRQAVRVAGTIERQCPSAGCWLFLRDPEGQSIRVELGDYFTELPRHVGQTAEVEGEWIPMGEGHQFIGTRITFGEEKSP